MRRGVRSSLAAVAVGNIAKAPQHNAEGQKHHGRDHRVSDERQRQGDVLDLGQYGTHKRHRFSIHALRPSGAA